MPTLDAEDVSLHVASDGDDSYFGAACFAARKIIIGNEL